MAEVGIYVCTYVYACPGIVLVEKIAIFSVAEMSTSIDRTLNVRREHFKIIYSTICQRGKKNKVHGEIGEICLKIERIGNP